MLLAAQRREPLVELRRVRNRSSPASSVQVWRASSWPRCTAAEREAVEQVARDEADREAVTRPVAVDHRPVVRDRAEPADP